MSQEDDRQRSSTAQLIARADEILGIGGSARTDLGSTDLVELKLLRDQYAGKADEGPDPQFPGFSKEMLTFILDRMEEISKERNKSRVSTAIVYIALFSLIAVTLDFSVASMSPAYRTSEQLMAIKPIVALVAVCVAAALGVIKADEIDGARTQDAITHTLQYVAIREEQKSREGNLASNSALLLQLQLQQRAADEADDSNRDDGDADTQANTNDDGR